MEEKLRLKCPICGKTLIVKYVSGIENMNIPCPVCKTVKKYTEYQTPISGPGNSGGSEITKKDSETDPADYKNSVIGKLQLMGTSKTYTLEAGRNTIGRKALSSSATIQIDTEDMLMSRSHAQIDVRKIESVGYKHYFSNHQNKNSTFVNTEKITPGDSLVLNNGDTIKMGKTTLKFIIAGGENTDY